MDPLNLTRRSFCRIAMLIPFSTVAQITGCASVSVYHGALTEGRVFVPFSEFNPERAAIVVHAVGMRDPAIVMHDGLGEYSAVSGRCTHQGCGVRPSGEFLQCPCHGSIFALDGSVLRGPAQTPLAQIPVELSAHGVELLLIARQ